MKRSKPFYMAAGAAAMLFFVAVLAAALWPPEDRRRVLADLRSASLAPFTSAEEKPPASAKGLSRAEVAFVHDRPALGLLTVSGEPRSTGNETLTEAQALKRMGRLYRYQASLLEARAEGDEEQAGRVLDEAMRELQALARHRDLWKNEELQQLYGHLSSAYRTHYGAPDTLSATRGDIFDTRDDLFAAVESARLEQAIGLSDAPLLEEASLDALQPEGTEVGLPLNSLTRGAMRFLQREPEDHVYRWMRRKETYFPMIEHIFAEAGVPDELKYLALVESGLNPQAQSWADAAGIWQFIPATARAYGLKITPWVDERLDPEQATRAAAAHLKDLYRMFGGDWHLALSGYNCSPTRIREAMRRVRREGKAPTFWNIYPYIPKETRNYVPTYVAAALMLSNPAQFGLKHVPPGPRYRFDRVPVEGMLPLQVAADLAGTTVKKLRALNPSLRQDVLPPSAGAFSLRVPYGTYEQFSEGYRALPDSAKGLTLAHRVRDGETPAGIAERYGVSLGALQKANSLEAGLDVAAGDSLAVPVATRYAEGNARPAEEAAAGDAAAGDATAGDAGAAQQRGQSPRRVQYSARTLRPLAASSGALPGSSSANGSEATYHVRRGDTLRGIARRYDVSVSDLRRWNDLPAGGRRLEAGQELRVQS